MIGLYLLTHPYKGPAVEKLAGLFILHTLKVLCTAGFKPHTFFIMARYIIFHKPFQVLSQFSAEGEKLTLAAYFPHLPKDIYPVGRLDYDSEGMLLLTDDKSLTHQLLTPSFSHQRTYWAQVEGSITDDALKQLGNGVTISVDGKQYKTRPAIATAFENEPDVSERNPPIRYRKNIPTSWISLTLTEGKNRQVRKMTAAVGFPTLRLIRFSIGSINISDVKPGEYKEITAVMKQQLFTSLK